MSEFGRRLLENGSFGTDHGHGNVMFVLGNHVTGGRVLTQWPGLAPNQLFEGRDLQVTIDFRDILSEIIKYRLGNANLASVFPGFTPTLRGITSNCQPGDFDRDGLVGTLDTAQMRACSTRANVPYSLQALPAGCTLTADTSGKLPADFDQDGDVDSDDFAEFQRCYAGDTVPNPNCAN
jgi:hypothetical protein